MISYFPNKSSEEKPKWFASMHMLLLLTMEKNVF